MKSKEEMIEDVESTEGENDTAVEQAKETEKTFSQSEVDNIVKARISRQKLDLDSMSKQHKQELESLQGEVETLSNALENVFTEQMKDANFDESILELLAEMPVLKKLEWLAKNKGKAKVKDLPVTPRETGKLEKPVYHPINKNLF